MNAALGGVSAGGLGVPVFNVTHSGGGPSAFVGNHPAGNMRGVTLSKFWLNVRGRKHRGQVSALLICAAIRPTATPDAISTLEKNRLRGRVGVNVHARSFVIASDVEPTLLPKLVQRCQFSSRRPTMVKSVCARPR